MLRPFPFLGAALAAASILFCTLGYTNTSGPDAAHTGAPTASGSGNEATCTECHSRSAMTDASKFQISALGNVTLFSPGQRVLMRVEHLNTGTRNGFELTVLNSSRARFGTLERTDIAHTRLTTSGQRTYISHNNAGSLLSSWDFAWTAPAALDTLTAFFYAAGIQANNNGNDDNGDQVYLSRLQLPAASGDSPSALGRLIAPGTVQVFPNPCVESVHATLQLTTGAPVVARLYNSAGIMDQERTFFLLAGKQTLRWQFDAKPAPGTYVLRLTAGGYTTAHRLAVQ